MQHLQVRRRPRLPRLDRRRRGRLAGAPARGSTASYFTTDAMGVALGQGASEWGGACAAVVEGGAPRVVENDHGQRRTPSVVAFADSGETLVGQPAKKLLFSRTATAVRGFEALLGVRHDSDECRRLIAEAALPYALAADDRGFAAVQVIARTPPLTSALASRTSPTSPPATPRPYRCSRRSTRPLSSRPP